MKTPTLIIVLIKDNSIHFSKNSSITISSTNLPHEDIQLSSRDIYWELKLEQYDHDTGKLDVFINNYDVDAPFSWVGRTPKYKIELLHFLELNWEELEQHLVYYNQAAKKQLECNKSSANTNIVSEAHLLHTVRISDLRIHNGYIIYQKKVSWAKEEVTFRINHGDMFEQLNFITPYFAKVIGKKTIDVNVTVGRQSEETIYLKTQSADLDKINTDTLYIIKHRQLADFKKALKKENGDNVMLTPEALQDLINDFGNIDSIERQLLFSILEKNKINNASQLLYLSEIISIEARLILTTQPQFGFIFTFIGDDFMHFIWELTNSHATYVWSLNNTKSVRENIKILEQEFTIITKQGRSFYRHSFEAQDDLFFHALNHKRSRDPMIDHFTYWKDRLEQLLV